LRRLKEIEIARGQVETIERLLLERFAWTTREKTGKIKEIRVYRNRTPQTRQKPPELKRFPMENEPLITPHDSSIVIFNFWSNLVHRKDRLLDLCY
jgi:hypothetical protein